MIQARARVLAIAMAIVAVGVALPMLFPKALPRAWAGNVAVGGTVADRSTNAAISGAHVTLSETLDFNGNGILDVYTATSDSSGAFSVTVPDTMPWLDIQIAAEGYRPFRQPSRLSPLNNVLTNACQMDADASFHAVAVSVSDTAGPVACARVYEIAAQASILGMTDSNGTAHISLAAGQRYLITVSAENRGTVSNFVDLSAMSTPYSVSFSLAGQTRGVLSGTFGAPTGTNWQFTRAGLSFLPGSSSPTQLRAAVQSTGAYTIYGIADGTYNAVLEADARVFVQAVNITAQTTSPLNITFSEISTADKSLTITLRDPAGNALGGHTVALGRVFQGVVFEMNQITTGTSGSATFTGLPAGDYIVFAEPGAQRKAIVASVTLSTSTSINATLPISSADVAFPDAGLNADGSKTVTGSVVDSSGSSVAGAHIAISVAGSRHILTTATSTSNGSYSLAGLAAGDYDVSAFAVVSGATLLQVEGPTKVSVTSSASSATAPTIALFAPHAATFIVLETDSNGDAQPVSGATVTLTEEGSDPAVTHSGTTSSSGMVTLSGLPLGTHDVTIEKSGYGTVTIKLPITSSHEVLSGYSALNVMISISAN